MNRDLIVGFVAIALVAAGAAPALAQNQETRELDADAEGTAQETDTTNVFDAEVNVTGDVTVQDSDDGVDETAFTDQPISAEVTVDDTTYEIPVFVNGEGVSLEQAGVTVDGWRLHVQGTQADGGQDATTAQFSGNLTLTGGQDGEYVLDGEGVLNVADDGDTTTYQLSYQGEATFE